jgi:accessory gene regulator B
MDKFTSYLVRKISETNPQFTDLELKKMGYGLLCLFDEVTKFVPYFIIFYLLSLQQYYVVAFIFFCPIRLFSGGYHSKTYWECFIISFIIFLTIIVISKYISLNFDILITLLIISIILVYRFSPVDNINKRIKSEERRKKLKYLSVITTLLLSGLCYLIPNKYFATAVISIIFAVVMMMTGYKNNRVYNNKSEYNSH